MIGWIIDDNEIDLLVTSKLLTNWEPSLSVKEFTHPPAALSELKSTPEPPQLIFLDLFMPGMSGWDFLDKYQHLNHSALLYVLSSSIDDADIERARGYGIVNGYLSKPVVQQSFLRILADYQQPSFMVG